MQHQLASVNDDNSLNPFPKKLMAIDLSNCKIGKGEYINTQGLLDTEFKLTLIPRNPKHYHDTTVRLVAYGDQVTHAVLAMLQSQWVH